jgi:hypothetical protein
LTLPDLPKALNDQLDGLKTAGLIATNSRRNDAGMIGYGPLL